MVEIAPVRVVGAMLGETAGNDANFDIRDAILGK
jgi:hypothetical protein